MSDYLVHYGTLGMKWGVRRYQNSDGTLTELGKKHYSHSGRFSIPEKKKNKAINAHESSNVISEAFRELKPFNKMVPYSDQQIIARQLAKKLDLDYDSAKFLVSTWFKSVARSGAENTRL